MDFALPDPRAFAPQRADALPRPAAELIDAAQSALGAEVAVIAEKEESRLIERMADHLLAADTAPIASALSAAPSLGALRLLARSLARAHGEAARRKHPSDGLAATVFALPVVIVAGSPSAVRVPGALPRIEEFVELLKTHRALRGNQAFALGNALVSSAAFTLEKLPGTLDWWRVDEGLGEPLALDRAPMALAANQEQVFLRFLIGRALAAPGVDLLSERDVGPWAMPFTQAFARQLGGGTLSLLAMARLPREPLAALYQGRIAQREVSLQLFMTNALRKFRQSVGEPAAVISAHRTDTGGEVRLSLSNPFDERGAEGFRAELFPTDRAESVAADMRALLAECRVEQVTVLADVFPDEDPVTRLPLLFRADALEHASMYALRLH
jgi:hypothetical protein